MAQGTTTRFDYVALAAVSGFVVLLYGMVAGARLVGHETRAPGALAPAVERPLGRAATVPRAEAAHGDLGSAGESPAILVEQVPSDLLQIASPAERKHLFIKLALPLIATINARIMAERRRILALKARSRRGIRALSPRERGWLVRLHERYGLERYDLDALLARIDVVPPSLALAQAAEESGWGTSRFVREGNALFGQRTFKKGQGLVPLARDPGAIHEVRTFERLLDSVASYAFNLNTHPAYAEFRRLRALQRRTVGVLDGYALARTLSRYSERGQAYVRTIRTIIRANALVAFDRVGTGEITLSRREPSI